MSAVVARRHGQVSAVIAHKQLLVFVSRAFRAKAGVSDGAFGCVGHGIPLRITDGSRATTAATLPDIGIKGAEHRF